MVKHRELVENERVCIKALHDAGWSLRQIGTGGLINLLSTVYLTVISITVKRDAMLSENGAQSK